MTPKRRADLCFFLGFAGVMYAVLFGTWKPDRPEFKLTLLALIVGVILITGSCIYFYKQKSKTDKPG